MNWITVKTNNKWHSVNKESKKNWKMCDYECVFRKRKTRKLTRDDRLSVVLYFNYTVDKIMKMRIQVSRMWQCSKHVNEFQSSHWYSCVFSYILRIVYLITSSSRLFSNVGSVELFGSIRYRDLIRSTSRWKGCKRKEL